MAHHGEMLVFPALVRARVLEQHGELRQLLGDLIADTAAMLRPGSAPDRGRLETAARELGARFRAHLAFEEEELTHVFAVLDAWGPERVRDLQEEHARQRRKLDAVVAGFEAEMAAEPMAEALLELAADLLRDMADEEEGCLRASLLGADTLTVERR
jgi:hypothetical protein